MQYYAFFCIGFSFLNFLPLNKIPFHLIINTVQDRQDAARQLYYLISKYAGFKTLVFTVSHKDYLPIKPWKGWTIIAVWLTDLFSSYKWAVKIGRCLDILQILNQGWKYTERIYWLWLIIFCVKKWATWFFGKISLK